MSVNIELKKSKMKWTLIILFGIIVLFTYILLYRAGVIHKNSFTEGINKQVAIVNKKTQNNSVAVNESQKNKELDEIRAEVQKSRDAIEEKEKLATRESKKQTIEANKKLTMDTEKREASTATLAKVKHELLDAFSQLKSPKEQQIIWAMSLTVSKMEADPTYNSFPDQSSVKAMYHKLDNDSKNRIKIALFMNVDSDSIGQLKKTFGL